MWDGSKPTVSTAEGTPNWASFPGEGPPRTLQKKTRDESQNAPRPAASNASRSRVPLTASNASRGLIPSAAGDASRQPDAAPPGVAGGAGAAAAVAAGAMVAVRAPSHAQWNALGCHAPP